MTSPPGPSPFVPTCASSSPPAAPTSRPTRAAPPCPEPPWSPSPSTPTTWPSRCGGPSITRRPREMAMPADGGTFVLVVDDDPGIRESIETLLPMFGHRVVGAGDGAEALARLRAGDRPCLILLDLMMPGLNG